MTLNMSADAVVTAALQRKGFSVTSQRIAVSRVVLGSKKHPTAQTILKEVRKAHPALSLATVYNTLGILRELNLVQELVFTRGEKRYDSYVRPHLNVICLQCGEISDINTRSCDEIVSRAVSKAKFTVTQHRFEIYGICDKCRRRSKLPWK